MKHPNTFLYLLSKVKAIVIYRDCYTKVDFSQSDCPSSKIACHQNTILSFVIYLDPNYKFTMEDLRSPFRQFFSSKTSILLLVSDYPSFVHKIFMYSQEYSQKKYLDENYEDIIIDYRSMG
ncbi:hypothetical protein Avbf_13976 [Armadillidium vulgare]|nr:hypothetical protein Avbf_13976 [Armadillidium vulgare]